MLEEKLIAAIKLKQIELADTAMRFPDKDKYFLLSGRFQGLEQALELINYLLNEEDKREF